MTSNPASASPGSGIAVVATVYNEEARIGAFLDSFSWSGELVVIDKSSTDRTAEIVKSRGARLVSVPYCDGMAPNLGEIVAGCASPWVWYVTASNLVHPQLVRDVLALTARPDFPADVIEYPHHYHVFGIRDPRSPWSEPWRRWLARKEMFRIADEVHGEIRIAPGARVHRMPAHAEHAVHHLTHETLDTFFERHHRYAKLEVELYRGLPAAEAMRAVRRKLWQSFKLVAWKKKSWRMGWDGVALGLAYVSYYLLVFLYVWQDRMGKGPKAYAQMRERYAQLWRDSGLDRND